MRLFNVIVVLALAAAASGSALAQEQPAKSDTAQPPSISDVMGQTPLRHFKLGYAGALGNWALANYEAGLVADSLHTTSMLFSAAGDARSGQMLKQDSTLALADIGRRPQRGGFRQGVRAVDDSLQRLPSDRPCRIHKDQGADQSFPSE
jgi:hypothetical protein